eukprot:gene9047-biopygen10933
MAASTPPTLDGVKRGRPLKQAIQECELRWFHETAVAAADGEANQMALLGHMYTVGYGCKPDALEASKWFAEASKRLGYNVLTDQPPLMSSVGPQLPQQAMQQQQQQQQAADQHLERLGQQQQQQQSQMHQQPWLHGASDPAGQAGTNTVVMLQSTGIDSNMALPSGSHQAAAAALGAVPSIL